MPPVLAWFAPLVAPALTGILKHFIVRLFGVEVAVRTFVDTGKYLAKHTETNIDDKFVNTGAKALGYGYDPKLDAEEVK